MGLSAGRLRQRVDLMRLVSVDNGNGGYSETWQTIAAAVPAEVIGLTGTEAVREKVLRGIRVYQITTRWREDLQPKDQLRFGDEDLNVRSAIDPFGRRDRLVILADTEGAEKTR
ncbi:head-tail adaptor protein [uncultured Sphingomonas sp.]|uniref:head-tail adaptor protein n=1 Tax=uncultured Sphingomonas sp. TaxID=158754 RepID=UPI0025D0694F|nr:head-tail adaptor protein [uncultured Sphingomonas sp.]